MSNRALHTLPSMSGSFSTNPTRSPNTTNTTLVPLDAALRPHHELGGALDHAVVLFVPDKPVYRHQHRFLHAIGNDLQQECKAVERGSGKR